MRDGVGGSPEIGPPSPPGCRVERHSAESVFSRDELQVHRNLTRSSGRTWSRFGSWSVPCAGRCSFFAVDATEASATAACTVAAKRGTKACAPLVVATSRVRKDVPITGTAIGTTGVAGPAA